MLEGWQADRGIRLVGKTGYRVTPPDVVAFSVEMGIGWHPDRPRILLASRIPLPWSQPTFDPAAFSSEMVSGSVPSRNREVLPRILGWISTPSDIQAFPLESIYGWLPARPRIFLAPRLPVRLDQAPDIPAGPIPTSGASSSHPGCCGACRPTS